MSSLFLFTHTQTKDGRSQSQIQSDVHEKLKEISEKIKRDGISLPEILRPLTQCAVADCVIGPSHIAMRLEDGRVCRIGFHINPERVLSKSEKKRGKLGDSRTGGSASLRDGSSAAVRGSSGGPCARSIRSPLNLLSRSSRGINLPREMQRQGICLSRPLASRIPASEVPESFIEQCQTVLQGKSRQLIIRELQRTNLDVNMTVNNLLSMDDEADQSGGNAGGAGTGSGGANSADDWEDDTEDLLSLLEHPEGHFLFEPDSLVGEEFFGPVRYRTDISQDYDYSFVSDRRKRRRLDTHLYLRGSEIYTNRSSVTGGAGIGESSGRSNVLDPLHPLNFHTNSDDSAVLPPPPSSQQTIQLGSRLEFWTHPPCSKEADSCGTPKFVQIAGLFSELVALSSCGELHQWRWSDATPYCSACFTSLSCPSSPAFMGISQLGSEVSESCKPTSFSSRDLIGDICFKALHHPRTASLGLLNERIIMLSGCGTRGSVLTASGKLATWMDDSLTNLLATAASTNSNKDQHNNLCILTARFEHPATNFQELRDERIVALFTAPLVTVARCLSGSIYWWGIYPSYMRQRAIERLRQYKSASAIGSSSAGPASKVLTSSNTKASFPADGGQTCGKSALSSVNVGPGALVCMKSAPIFHAGALGFAVVNGVPKVGTLLEDAWKLTDVCRFRVRVPNSTNINSSESKICIDDNINTGSSITTSGQRLMMGTPNPLDPAQHTLTCPHALVALSVAAAAAVGQHVHANPVSPASIGLEHGSSTLAVTSAQVGAAPSSLPEMPPPPSPASSTCSEQSGPVRVSPGTFNRKKAPSISGEREQLQQRQERLVTDWETTSTVGVSSLSGSRSLRRRSVDRELTGASSGVSFSGLLPAKRQATSNNTCISSSASPEEEDWCLSDVIFVEDGRTQPVGVVLKVDGGIAAVKFLKEQERACLAVNCMYSPVTTLINSLAGGCGGSTAGSSCISGPLSGSSVVTGKLTPSCTGNMTYTTSAFLPASGSSSSGQASSSPGGATVPTTTSSTVLQVSNDPMAWLNDCRLLRKDDLAVVRNVSSPRVPEFVQRSPRRLVAFAHPSASSNVNDSSSIGITTPGIQALAVENGRVHLIVSRSEDIPPFSTGLTSHRNTYRQTRAGTLPVHSANKQSKMLRMDYLIFNMLGKLISGHRMPASANAFQTLPPSVNPLHSRSGYKYRFHAPGGSLVCPAERPMLLRDACGILFPFIPPSRPSNQESWALPAWLDLPPIRCAAFAWINLSSHAGSISSSVGTSNAGGNTSNSAGSGQVTFGLRGSNSSVGANHLSTRSSSTAPVPSGPPRLLVGFVVVQTLTLMPHILRANATGVESLLNQPDGEPSFFESVAQERADGNRNVLHMAVMMCTPLSNREVEWSTQLHSALYSKPSQDLSLNISDKMPSSPSRDATNSLSQKQQSMSNRPAVISYNGSSRSSNAYSMHELFFLPSVDSGSVSSAEAKMLTSGSSDSRHNRTAPLANSESSASSASFWHLAPLRSDELTRRLASYRIVSCLVESFGLHSHLINLLTARNADGQTPFMLAIACRAYQVASFIYDVIKKLEADFIGKKVPFNKMDAIFPASNLDDSPLFTLVYNDMCSFTWTGPSHIRQDIYECRTCGLMDSLCCCIDCARICHKGHDCRLKRTSPTAYCDCWEKYRCKSLVAGYQPARHSLLYRLLTETRLVCQPNGRGEHLLLFLAKCVERQYREQKQYRPSRRRFGTNSAAGGGGASSRLASVSSSTANEGSSGVSSGSAAPEEPDHDSTPPRFTRDAFELALDCPLAVESMLNMGVEVDPEPISVSGSSALCLLEEQVVLSFQSASCHLDDFVFTLICKCPQTELIDALLRTLNWQLAIAKLEHATSVLDEKEENGICFDAKQPSILVELFKDTSSTCPKETTETLAKLKTDASQDTCHQVPNTVAEQLGRTTESVNTIATIESDGGSSQISSSLAGRFFDRREKQDLPNQRESKIRPALRLEQTDRMCRAAGRFVRSVARIYTCLALELTPDYYKKKTRPTLSQTRPLEVCRHIFFKLAPIVLAELPVIATGLLGPVRTGALRPSAFFSLSTQSNDAINGLEQVLNIERSQATRRQLALLSDAHSSLNLRSHMPTSGAPENRRDSNSRGQRPQSFSFTIRRSHRGSSRHSGTTDSTFSMRSGTAQPRSTSRLSSPPPHQQQSTNAGLSRHYTSHQHSHRHLRRHRPGFTAVAASGGFNTSSRSNDPQSGLPLSHLAASRISLTSPTANTSVGNDVISLPLSDISSSSHVDDLTSSSQLDNSEVRELMSEEVIVQTLTERRSPRVNLSQHRSLASDPRVTEEDLGSDGHSNAKGRSGCASNSVVSPTTNADTVLVSETESESESGELSGQHLEREGYVVRSTILESEAHNSPTRPHSDGEDDGDDTVEEKADIDDEDDRAIIEPAPDDIEDDMTDRGTDNEQDDHEARARVAERVRPYDDLYFSSHGDEYDDDEEAGNDDGDNDNDNDDDDEVEREQNDEDDNDERGVEAQIRELLRSPHHREDRDPILNVDSGSDVIDSDSSERRQYSALRGHNISRHCPRLTLVPLAFRGSASAIEGGGSSIATDYDTLESDILHVGSRPSIDVPSRHRKRRHQRSRSRSHDGCRGNRSKRRTQRRKPSEADCEDNLGNDMSDGRRRHKTSAASRSSFSARRRHRQHETKRHRRKRHHRIDDAPADETLTDASCLRCSRRRRRAGSDLDYRCDSPICRRHHRYSSLGRDADGNGVGDGGSMGRDVGGEAGGDRASLASSTAATVGTVGSIIDLDATSDTGGGWGGSVSSSILVAGRFCAPGPSNVGPRAVGLLGSGSAISPATTPSGGVDEEEEGEDEADEKDSQVDVPSHAIAVEEDQLEASDQVRHLCTDSSSLSLPVSTQFGLNLSLEPSLYNLDADGLYSRHFSESLVGRLDAPNVPLIPTSDDRDVATIQINSGSDAPASGFASLLASARLLQQETIMDVCSSNLMADRTRDRASSEGAGCTDTLPELRNSNETMIGLSVTQLAPDDGDDGDDDDDDTARLASSNPVDICSRTREDTGRTRTKSASDDNINTLQRHHRRNRRNSRRRRYRRSREQELSSGSRRASTLTASAITLDGGDVSEQEQNRPILDDYLDDVNQLGPRTYDNEDDPEDDDEGEDLVGIGEDGDEDGDEEEDDDYEEDLEEAIHIRETVDEDAGSSSSVEDDEDDVALEDEDGHELDDEEDEDAEVEDDEDEELEDEEDLEEDEVEEDDEEDDEEEDDEAEGEHDLEDDDDGAEDDDHNSSGSSEDADDSAMDNTGFTSVVSTRSASPSWPLSAVSSGGVTASPSAPSSTFLGSLHLGGMTTCSLRYRSRRRGGSNSSAAGSRVSGETAVRVMAGSGGSIASSSSTAGSLSTVAANGLSNTGSIGGTPVARLLSATGALGLTTSATTTSSSPSTTNHFVRGSGGLSQSSANGINMSSGPASGSSGLGAQRRSFISSINIFSTGASANSPVVSGSNTTNANNENNTEWTNSASSGTSSSAGISANSLSAPLIMTNDTSSARALAFFETSPVYVESESKEVGMRSAQVQLSRAFACLIRIIADLIVDLRSQHQQQIIHQDITSNSSSLSSVLTALRRCTSAPAGLYPAAALIAPSQHYTSVYQQQRLYPLYAEPTASYTTNTSVPATASTGIHPNGTSTSIGFNSGLLSVPRLPFRQPETPGIMSCLFGLSEQEQAKACAGVGLALSPVWSWLAGAMDSLEAQLRFRAAWNRQAQQLAAYATGIQLANSNNANPLASSAASVTVDDLSQPESESVGRRSGTRLSDFHGNILSNSLAQQNASSSTGGNSSGTAGDNRISTAVVSSGNTNNMRRQDFIAYLLSLMRASGNDHGDSVPLIDAPSHKHLAYVVDAFLYFFKSFELAWPAGLVHFLSDSTQGVDTFDACENRQSKNASVQQNRSDTKCISSWWPNYAENASDADNDDDIEMPEITKSLQFGGASKNTENPEQTFRGDTTNSSVSSLPTTFASLSGIRLARRTDTFFRRSESTLSLAGAGLDPIETPLAEALPLATQPHLLRPTTSRSELFGISRHLPSDVTMSGLKQRPNDRLPLHMMGGISLWGDWVASGGDPARSIHPSSLHGPTNQAISSNACSSLSPESFGASREAKNTTTKSDEGIQNEISCLPRCNDTHLSMSHWRSENINQHPNLQREMMTQLLVGGGFLDSIGHADIILSRWCLSLELFGHFFADDVGAEHRSYILELAGFPTREARFRKEMERLRNASRGDLTLEVGRERGLLIINTIKQLNCEYVKRLDQSNCGLASHFATGLLPSASAASLLGPSSPTSTADSHSRPQPHQLHQHNQAFMRSETNLTDSLLTAASATAGYNGLIDYINQDGTCYIQPQSQGIGHSAAQLPTNQHLREPLVRQTSTVAATTALSLAGSSLQPLLACHRVKVTFRDEPGEGNGVARSFFTAFAEALLVSDELPSLNSVLGFSNTISVNGISPSVATPPPPPIGSIYTHHPHIHHRHYTGLNRPFSSLPRTCSSLSNNSSVYANVITSSAVNAGSMVTSAPSAFSSSSIGPSLVYASGEPAASQNSTSAHITHAYYVYPNSSASLANLGLAGTPGVGASRLRSSAWRRAGGLSARALPFYPTVTTSEPNTPISEQSETTAAGYLSASQTTVNNSAAAAAAAIAAAFAASTFSTSNGSLHSNIHTIGISSTNSNTSINTSTVLETGNSIFSPAVLSNTATSNSSVRQSIVGPGRPSLITPTANVSPQSFPSGSQSPQRLSPGISPSDGSSPSSGICGANQSSQQVIVTARRQLGNRLHARLLRLTNCEHQAARITGMLLELPSSEHFILLTNDDALRNRVEEARAVLMMVSSASSSTVITPAPLNHSSLTSTGTNISSANTLNHSRSVSFSQIGPNPINFQTGNEAIIASTVESSITNVPSIDAKSSANNTEPSDTSQVKESGIVEPERAPLFWQPGLRGFYSPRAVPTTCDPSKLAARFSIYRGIGRVTGLCLLSNEICPLYLNRHVLKYILGRPLHWHDFAFYDPVMYESLREMMLQAKRNLKPDPIVDYGLTFSLFLSPEEGGKSSLSSASGANSCVHCLVNGGNEIEVNSENVFEFVKRYTSFKMFDAIKEPLQQMRAGVFDVLPRNALDDLTTEDLRLLLNGVGEINVDTLVSYTTFNDETGGGTQQMQPQDSSSVSSKQINNNDRVARLKRWFWSTVRAMDIKQRQDLLYFWTSSPALPASAQGFQPMPTVTIRPADDHHLPTANTCISRLYLPLYSSKQILKDKLLQAIQTKGFGFV